MKFKDKDIVRLKQDEKMEIYELNGIHYISLGHGNTNYFYVIPEDAEDNDYEKFISWYDLVALVGESIPVASGYYYSVRTTKCLYRISMHVSGNSYTLEPFINTVNHVFDFNEDKYELYDNSIPELNEEIDIIIKQDFIYENLKNISKKLLGLIYGVVEDEIANAKLD